ncbi:MAG: hypothetical protein FJ320_06410 [SAR202 cluster bacterium]|nr:hypothetical protein [SAR202 cluster bacterium]
MPFVLDYLVFVFISALGVLQMAASYSLLKGVYLIPHRAVTFIFGLALTTGAFGWFFASEPRNVPDTEAGLNGNQQAMLFVAACGAAVVFTMAVSSLVNWQMRPKDGRYLAGMSALRHASFIHALSASFRGIRSR